MIGPPPLQNLLELDELLQLVEQLQPAHSLEIGVHVGGTLYQWKRLTSDLVYAIDLEHKARAEYDGWPGCRVEVDYGPSQSPMCVQRAGIYAPFDFIFVDGDHHYDKVRADVENFWPLLRDGGVMALHDIAVGRTDVPANIKLLAGEGHADDMIDDGPRRLWRQLLAGTVVLPFGDTPFDGYDLSQIIGPRDTNPLGIGVIRKGAT